MSLFPIFIDLNGKKCLVVGAGTVATRKINTLLNFSADIRVVAIEASKEIETLNQNGIICYEKKEFEINDVDGSVLVIAASNDTKINALVADCATQKGIPVNVVDNQTKCTFVFPSVVNNGDVVVGISSSGSFPILSRHLREKCQKCLKKYDEKMLGILKRYRQIASERIVDPIKREDFLEKMFNLVIDSMDKDDLNSIELQLKHILEYNA